MDETLRLQLMFAKECAMTVAFFLMALLQTKPSFLYYADMTLAVTSGVLAIASLVVLVVR